MLAYPIDHRIRLGDDHITLDLTVVTNFVGYHMRDFLMNMTKQANLKKQCLKKKENQSED
jgi:hypothetical protein